MPRIARFTIDNGTYHVMQRGVDKQKIFKQRDDYLKYIELIKKNKFQLKVKIYHYALMPNHVHMIINSNTGEELSEFFKKIGVSYSGYFRRKYGGVGHFFQDRFRSFLIQEGIYLLECGRYVELNPVKACLVRHPDEYEWSSYKCYMGITVNGFIDISPEYLALNENNEERKKIYKEYIYSGLGERRNEERFFREGIYGSKEYKNKLVHKGLVTKWSHSGRPKNSGN